jgi:peptidoglycan-N-acetylglucosamine deacetylase
MRLFRPGILSGWIYSDALFRIETNEKVLCLTFDDGPDSVSTPLILEILCRYNIKALFFCNGEKAERNPGIIEIIRSGGHIIGNHGYEHLDGWTTSLKCYVNNITKAAQFTSERLFRPPYGHLRIGQYRMLKNSYKIMFWDLMPFDFDNSFGRENSLRVLKNKIRPGSVLVFHDTQHSSAILILEDFIKYSLGAGYRFILPDELNPL